MKNFFSTIIFIALFAVLGFAAYSTIPRGDANIAGSASTFETSSETQRVAAAAPAAALVYNAVSLPLDVTSNWTNQGIAFNAAGLATYVGSPVKQVVRWNPNVSPQQFDTWFVDDGEGIVNGNFIFDPNQFPLEVGGSYWIQVDNSDPNLDVVSFVGDVPAEGSISFTLKGGTATCANNQIMVPLDQHDQSIANGVDLATSIANSNSLNVNDIEQILSWNPTVTPVQFDVWYVADGEGIVDGNFIFDPNQFVVEIGHPYWVCVASAGDGAVWPQ